MIAGTATTGKVLESVSACISTMPFLRSLLLCGFILLELSYAAVHLNTWAVHIEGGESVAKRIAEENGFIYNGHIFDDYHEFTHNHVAKRSTSSNTHHHNLLKNHPQVRWCEQQVVKRRVKRDLVRDQRDEGNFNDPKWPKMWYLRRSDAPNMNVVPAWRKGYTGKGVVVSILDDGIERDHPDLLDNYDPDASYDVNGHDNDPQPRYDYSNENRHGTRCAGEVAAVANNHICNIGIAFEASIGGVRMLDGDVTDSVEAKSLSYHPQHIHIYSASWGPDDDGRTVDGPATLARNAFYNGITKGRGGLGSIFVWASGNGGRDGDSCNCDGYTNSIYTLSISSATENGNIPWYSEACSSTLATTYSSGSGSEKQIVTTDLRKGCTETHTGTSASAPLAAGIVALALHSNPKMTWRDLQHIVVMTARPANLHAGDWVTNGVGRRVSHSFGYGLMDAAAMTDLARNWTVVPEQKICEIRSGDTNRIIPVNGKLQVRIESNGCDRTKNHVAYLEHVQAKVTITSSRRGDMQIYLISPQGTRSTLLARRVRDNSGEGFNDWAFMTTHSWGETSKGRWTLEVENLSSISELRHWSLVLYGTPTHPQRGASTNNQVSPHHPRTTPVFSGACHGVVLGNGSCVACGDLYYLKGFCYKKCTSNFYGTRKEFPQGNETEKHNVCLPCATYCRECDGQSMDDCKECIEGFDLKNQTCVRTFLYLGIFEKSTFVMSGLAVALCAVPVILFFLIFTFLQAREQGWFCFRNKMPVYIPVDADAAATDTAANTDVEFHKEKNGNAVVDIKIEKNGQHQALLDMESDEEDEIFSGPAPY